MDQNFSKHHIDDSGNIIDASGRVRVFHGVNFVRKEPPWYHEELLSSSYAKDLWAWGLNVVSLGTMWSGMEPREGYYDMEYVDKLKQIVTNFRDEGIYAPGRGLQGVHDLPSHIPMHNQFIDRKNLNNISEWTDQNLKKLKVS